MKPAQTSNVGVAVVRPRANAEPTTFRKTKDERMDDLLETAAEGDRYKQDLADAQKANQEFNSLAEKLAHTSVFTRNVTVPVLVDAFPGQFMNWHVSQVFAHARGGVLYTDNAHFEFDVEQCRRKAAVMRKAGLRYVWLEANDTVESAERKLKGELK